MNPVTAHQCIKAEYMRARQMYSNFNNPHEGLAVILEEFEELKKEVFKKQKDHDMAAMRKEACQLGAMAMRFMVECT